MNFSDSLTNEVISVQTQWKLTDMENAPNDGEIHANVPNIKVVEIHAYMSVEIHATCHLETFLS